MILKFWRLAPHDFRAPQRRLAGPKRVSDGRGVLSVLLVILETTVITPSPERRRTLEIGHLHGKADSRSREISLDFCERIL
jgi:hypothetical protein